MKYLFLSYTLPTEPSKARVYVWRQLKKLGAISFQTVWVIPYSQSTVSELNKIVEFVESQRGSALIIEGKAMNNKQHEMIHKTFLESMDEEYREFIHKCDDYFNEIISEIENKNFIFAEVEENEEEMEKLRKWLSKIEKRYSVKSGLKKLAHQKMKSCERMFEDFAKMVYEHQQKKVENGNHIFKRKHRLSLLRP